MRKAADFGDREDKTNQAKPQQPKVPMDGEDNAGDQ